MSGRRRVWLAPLAAAAVALLTWRAVLGWALLGWDSYPMVVAGRVDGLGQVFATFGEELMEGRYPLGSFWRPVVHLAFALDHALFGLDPLGYHLSDLIVLACSAALVALLAERLFAGAGRWPLAGLAAGLAFALHPLHYEVLPVAPRRADGLAVLFTLAALYLALTALRRRDAGRPGAAWPAWLAALACGLALASKETGAIAPVALGLLALLVPARRAGEDAAGDVQAPEAAPRAGRLARALRVVWPAALVVALTFALRTAVLGGLGGGQESYLTSGLARAHVFAATYARALLLPPGVWELDPGEAAPAFVALGVVAVLGAAVALRGGPRLRAGALFLAAWAVLLLPLTGMSALAQGWYAFPYLPALALSAGLLAAAGERALDRGRRPEGGAWLLAGLALALAGTPGTPWLDDPSDFDRASELERDFLERFDQALAAATPGRPLTVRGCPTLVQRVRQRSTGEVAYHVGPNANLPPDQFEAGRLIYGLAGYSLEAYADLTLGAGRARVTLPGLPPSPRAPSPELIDVTVLSPQPPWVR